MKSQDTTAPLSASAQDRKCFRVATLGPKAYTDLPTLGRPLSAFQALHKVFHFHYLCHWNHDILIALAG